MSDLTSDEIISDELKTLYRSYLQELTRKELNHRLTKSDLIGAILDEDPTGKEDCQFRDSIN